MASSHTSTYHANIRSLSRRQPAVAATVEATPVPANICEARGRDGTATYRLRSPDGRLTWFGASSAPGVSARALAQKLDAPGASLAMPGVLTGAEPLALVALMWRHCALFVLEPDAWRLKLALHLHDFTGPIEAGRVVFVLADRGTGALEAFLEAHLGYEYPAKMLTIPHWSRTELADWQRSLESGSMAVMRSRAAAVESWTREHSSSRAGRLPDGPGVVVLGVSAGAESIEQAHRIGRSLNQIGWPGEVCVPDAPERCHVLARLGAVQRISADMLLFVNTTAGAMRQQLPSDMPLATWFLPGEPAAVASQEPLGPTELVCVCSAPQRADLESAGIPADRILLLEPAAEDALAHGATATPSAGADPTPTESIVCSSDVAVVLDLPDLRPEAANVTLASQVVLYQEVINVAARRADRAEHDAMAWLDEAQRTTGIKLTDQKLVQWFVSLIQKRVMPVAQARDSVERVLSKGYRVAVRGLNWEPFERDGVSVDASSAVGSVPERVRGIARVVLFPVASDQAVASALDCLLAGIAVVFQGEVDAFGERYPGLASLAEFFNLYRTNAELVGRLQSVLAPRQADTASKAAQTDSVKTAAARIAEAHTIGCRLVTLRDALRHLQKP